MLTKEEILRDNGTYRDTHILSSYFLKDWEKAIEGSMEDYAKQEALEFSRFTASNLREYTGWNYDELWNEYQKSKLKQ